MLDLVRTSTIINELKETMFKLLKESITTVSQQMEMLNTGIKMIKNSYNQKQKTPNTPWYVMRGYFISVVFFPKIYNLSVIMRKQQRATWNRSTRAPD